MEGPPTQNSQLLSYVRKNLEKGYSPDTLKYSLLSQGYSRTSVEKAIETAQHEIASRIPPIPEKPKIVEIDEEEIRIRLGSHGGESFMSKVKKFFLD